MEEQLSCKKLGKRAILKFVSRSKSERILLVSLTLVCFVVVIFTVIFLFSLKPVSNALVLFS